MGRFSRFITVIGLLIYVLDVSTYTNSVVKYLSNSDYWWGGLTVVFTVLPLLFASILCIGLNIIPSNNSMPVKYILVLAAILAAPLLTFAWLLLDCVFAAIEKEGDNDEDNDNDDDPVGARFLKLCVAIVESFPQAALLKYIISQSLYGGNAINAWQWSAISASLNAFAFAISTSVIFGKGNIISNAAFFTFGWLATTYRLAMCSVFSMLYSPWWFVPFSTELAASIIVLGIIIYKESDEIPPCNEILFAISVGVPAFALAVAYNGFSMFGLMISAINVSFAVTITIRTVPFFKDTRKG